MLFLFNIINYNYYFKILNIIGNIIIHNKTNNYKYRV